MRKKETRLAWDQEITRGSTEMPDHFNSEVESTVSSSRLLSEKIVVRIHASEPIYDAERQVVARSVFQTE